MEIWLIGALGGVLAAVLGWIARRLEKRLDAQDKALRIISRRLRDVRRQVGVWRREDDATDDTIPAGLPDPDDV